MLATARIDEIVSAKMAFRAFCPTGPGGGVDNSCSSSGGGGAGGGDAESEDGGQWPDNSGTDENSPNRLTDAEKGIAHAKLDSLPTHYEEYGQSKVKSLNLADIGWRPVDALRVYGVSSTAEKHATEFSVPLDVINRSQSSVPYGGVKKYIDAPPDRLPTAIVDLEKNLITVGEGHTRLSAQILAGRSASQVKLMRIKDGKYVRKRVSQQELDGLVERIRSKGGVGDKAFCPTGEGGGIDNSCGGGSSGGSVSGAIASVLEHTGYSKEQLAKGLNGDASPKNSQAAKMRARVAGSVLLSGKAVKDAINDVLDEHDKAAVNAKVKELTKGNVAAAQKEFGGIPMYDLEVLSAMEVKAGPVEGEAVCYMAERRIVMGSTTRSGSYRHELGHAVRSMLGGESSSGKTQMTKAVAAEYEDAKARFKADPPKPGEKLDHEAYETRYGLVGRRGLDNWEEHFAEHYRLYHREVHRDRNEGGDGKFIKQYRERHPGWAKIWDAHYTAALIGGELAKTKE